MPGRKPRCDKKAHDYSDSDLSGFGGTTTVQFSTVKHRTCAENEIEFYGTDGSKRRPGFIRKL
ncbi:unnamed protein product [Plutella xylostella]|uniref:(diamondback moth) hypothetical protein n=1 Tax=Plutella xylostella TaxID=51655 RepID=A0A8S4G635_PLUXY|nr:unnamed protein product [Plutella xylostella]